MTLLQPTGRSGAIAVAAGAFVLVCGIAGYVVLAFAADDNKAGNLMLFVIPVVQVLFGQPAKQSADDAADKAEAAARKAKGE